MNTDWQWVQLGEISEVISKGTTPTTHGVAFLDSGIPFLRAEDVVGGAVDTTSVKYYVSDKTHDTLLARSKLQPGDFLITIAGSLGRVGYVPLNAPPLNCNQAVAFVRLKPNTIDLNFLLYVFQYEGITKSLLDVQKVGTIGNLNLEQIRDFKTPLPPLTEQKRIASLLARADRLCQLRRTAHDLGDALLQSVFLEMFGDPVLNEKSWDSLEFGEVVQFISGHGFKLSEYLPSGVRLLQIANVSFQEIIWDNLAYLPLEYKESYSNLLLQDGDLLMALNRPILGDRIKFAFLKSNDTPAILYQRVGKLVIDKKKLNPQFLYGFMLTRYFYNELKKRLSGSDQPYINPTELVKMKFFLPPLSLQEEFASVVARVEGLRRRMSEAGRQVEGLFESMLAEAFL